MRVLMIADYAGAFPYIDELAMHLHAKGIESWCLDIFKLEYRKFEGGQLYSASKPITKIGLLKWFLIMSKRVAHQKWGRPIYDASRGLLQKLVRTFLEHHSEQFDVTVIQYVNPELLPFIGDLKRTSKGLIAAIWGSDFYRATDDTRRKQQEIYDLSNAIIFGNPKTAEDFIGYYGAYSNKSVSATFGIGKLDLLRDLLKQDSREQSRIALGLPLDKLNVACGYNGGVAQQHELIINAVSQLPIEDKERLHLIFLMSYGANKERLNNVRRLSEEAGLSYTVIERFLTDDEIVKLRLATDLVINAQTTDSLSASLREHLFAQNVLLVGDWLPYQIFNDLGVSFVTFKEGELFVQLKHVLSNWNHFAAQTSGNTEKIYRLSGWQYAIDNWIAAFYQVAGKTIPKSLLRPDISNL